MEEWKWENGKMEKWKMGSKRKENEEELLAGGDKLCQNVKH